MEVNRTNAALMRNDFLRELDRCEFCAVDQEMTGVDVPGQDTQFGTPPEEVYRTKRIACEAYSVIQFGIALFTKTPDDNYEVRPHNFYLLQGDGDLRLSMGAIGFLAQHKMNFQTWLTTGMPYCTAAGEAAILEDEKPPQREYTPDDAARLAEVVAQIAHWYEFETQADAHQIDATATVDIALGVKDHFRRLDAIQADIHFDVLDDSTVRFAMQRLDKDAWQEARTARTERSEKQRIAKLGFRVFWKAICESKKPIVGHNFLQDLMFMMHMNEKALPQDYEEFKEDVQKCLPQIFDTKTLASDIEDGTLFEKTHLGILFNACRTRAGWQKSRLAKHFRLPPGFYAYDESQILTSNRAHEGAYDAYMTGIVFIYFQHNYPQETLAHVNSIAAFGSSYRHHMAGPDRLLVSRRTPHSPK